MPTETGRTTARKRITLPGGGHVDVKVITKISFVDANDRYQETQYTIDNSHTSVRKVHVDNVYQSGMTSGSSIAVERIDQWPVFDAADRGQETQITIDNVTGATSNPPNFTAHKKTHVVRYFNPADNTQYIDSELIDELHVIDPNSRAQETQFILNNPPNDDTAQADPSDPEISDTANGIDAPWRTDPFQNIIGFGAGGGFSLLLYAFFTQRGTPSAPSSVFDATISMAGWSVGDTWSGLPTPSGQGTLVTATDDIANFPNASTDTLFFAYTPGAPVSTAFADWNDTFTFTITWAVRLGFTSTRQILTEQTYDISGATFVHNGQNFEIAGTNPNTLLLFNHWTDESFPPNTPGLPPGTTGGIPALWILMLPVT